MSSGTSSSSMRQFATSSSIASGLVLVWLLVVAVILFLSVVGPCQTKVTTFPSHPLKLLEKCQNCLFLALFEKSEWSKVVIFTSTNA